MDDFWDDLVVSVKEDRSHFFGIIYLQEIDGVSRIMDGQQRMTTTMLFLWCVREYLKNNRMDTSKINSLDNLLRINGKFKLTLSKANNEFFQNLLNGKFSTKGDFEGAVDSDPNKKLYKAYKKLRGSIENYGKEYGNDSIIVLVDHLLDEFSLYSVPADTHDAYTMFNLINNRGLTLEQHDLIRSYVFGELDKNDNVDDELSDEVDVYWHEITRNTQKGTNYTMNTFFQHVLNLTGLEFVKDKDIYEATRKRVSVDHILDWVKDVKEWSKIAHDLRNPKGNFLDHSHKSQPCEIHLDRIHKIGASAVIPLLMAGYKKYWSSGDHKSFNRLAEACLKYHLRTQTIGKASVEKYQKHIFKVAYDFYNEADPLDVRKVIVALKDGDLYPSGVKLHTLLKEGYGPNTSIATVLLELIEENQSDKLSHTSVTVEHILPKSLSGEWRRYISKCHLGCGEIEAAQIHKKYHTYLGNLTLLNRGQNSKGKNNLFNIKKKLYKKTDYKITRELADVPQWGEDQIIDRHGKFVDKLLQILR